MVTYCNHKRHTAGPPPFIPENIVRVDGRWVFDGVDVSDRQVSWNCPEGHAYQETIANRVDGVKCPVCGC